MSSLLGPTDTLLGSRRASTAGTGLASTMPGSTSASQGGAKKLGGGLSGTLSPEPVAGKKKKKGKKKDEPKRAASAQGTSATTAAGGARPPRPAAGAGSGFRDPMAVAFARDEDDDNDAFSIGGDDDEDDLDMASSSGSDIPEIGKAPLSGQQPAQPAAQAEQPQGQPHRRPLLRPPGGGGPRSGQRTPSDRSASPSAYDDSFEGAEVSSGAAGWGGQGGEGARGVQGGTAGAGGQEVHKSCTRTTTQPSLPSQRGKPQAPAQLQRQSTQPAVRAQSVTTGTGGGGGAGRQVDFDIPVNAFRGSGGGTPLPTATGAGVAGAGAGGEVPNPVVSAAANACGGGPACGTPTPLQPQPDAQAAVAAARHANQLESENRQLKDRVDGLMREQQLAKERTDAERAAELARAASAHDAELKRLETAKQRERIEAQVRESGLRQELEAARADAEARTRALQADLAAAHKDKDTMVGRLREEMRHAVQAADAEAAREREAAGVREAEARTAREDLSRARAEHADELRRMRAVQAEASSARAAAHAQELEAFSEQKAQLSRMLTVADEVKEAVAAIQLLQRKVEVNTASAAPSAQGVAPPVDPAKRAEMELLEERLGQQQAALAAERRQISALVAGVQDSVRSVKDMGEAERTRVGEEHQSLQRLVASLEQERRETGAALREERRRLDEMRNERDRERAEHVAALDAQREELTAEQARVTHAAEDLARERATVVARSAEAEARLSGLKKELEMEKAAVDETKAQLAEQKQELVDAQRELERERAEFWEQADALRNLALEVQRESRDVARTHESARAQLQAAQDLEDKAEAMKAEAGVAHAAIEERAQALQNRRRGFEEERLAAARERRALQSDRIAVSRTAEATRSLQLQLVGQLSAAADEDHGSLEGGEGGGTNPPDARGNVDAPGRDAWAPAPRPRAAREGGDWDPVAHATDARARLEAELRQRRAVPATTPEAVAMGAARSPPALEAVLLQEERERMQAQLRDQSAFIQQLRTQGSERALPRPTAPIGFPPPPAPLGTFVAAPYAWAQQAGASGGGRASVGEQSANAGSASDRRSLLASAFPPMVHVSTPSSSNTRIAAGTGQEKHLAHTSADTRRQGVAASSTARASSLRGSSLLSSWSLGDAGCAPAGGADSREAPEGGGPQAQQPLRPTGAGGASTGSSVGCVQPLAE